jgi:hypothetical protein
MGTLHYQLVIRNADDDGNLLSVSSIRGDTSPYIASPPQGDGEEVDPLTGQVTVGAYTVEVIDGIGTVGVTTLVASDGFEYADLAALNAVWPETDTLGALSTWSIETTEVQEGTYAAEITVEGTATAGQESVRTRTFTGLTPDATHRLEIGVWLNEEFGANVGADLRFGIRVVGQGEAFVLTPGAGATIAAWTQLVLVAVADGSGELTVEIGAFHASATPHARLARFDDLRIYELVTGEGRVVTEVLSDVNARQQLLSKKALLWISEDEGDTWDNLLTGYVNRVALVNALKYEFTIGESKRVEQTRKVFDRIPTAAQYAAYETTYGSSAIGVLDRASCIIGGPIIGDWGPSQDRGRPIFRVDALFGSVVRLKWVEGFVSANFAEREPPVRDDVEKFMNAAALEYLDATAPSIGLDGATVAQLPGLVARIYDVASGEWDSDHVPMAWSADSGFLRRFIGDWVFTGDSVVFHVQWNGTLPSEGDRVRVAVFPRAVSPRNPFHWSGHPVDLAAQLMALYGIPFDAGSQATVKAALGNLVVHLRITRSDTLTQFLEATVYGPFGFATRSNSDGEAEFFLTRTSGQSPVATITLADLYSDEGTAWELEEATAANLVTWTSKSFVVNDNSGSVDDSTPIDCIMEAEITVPVVADDEEGEAVFGEKEIRFDLPGEIEGYSTGSTENPGALDLFVAALAQPLFDWNGRGAIQGEFHVGRWSPAYDALIGQELIVDCPHIPSASTSQSPTSQRGTFARRGFILHKTVSPSGATFMLEDRGPASLVVPVIGTNDLIPTFTLAADATFPKKVVEVTITNEADLLAGAVNVRVEMSTATEPTAGQSVRVWHPDVDDNPFDLPPVCAGSVVSVRMRAEGTGDQAGAFGPWTPFQSLDLADLVPPTSLAAAVDGTTLFLTWTNGETGVAVEVLYRQDTETTFTGAATLPAGSISYVLTLATAAVDYVVAVRHVDGACRSTMNELAVETDTALGLQPPIDPVAFSDGRGTHGLEVTATEIPSATEFWGASETDPGTGIACDYVLVGVIPSVPGGRTRFQHPLIAAKDGLLRFWKARHIRLGLTPSAYTDPVSIDPWQEVAPEPPTPTPEPFPGLTEVPVKIPLLGSTLPRRYKSVPEAATALDPFNASQTKFPLGTFTAARIVAVVTETSLPVGAVVAAQLEHPESPDVWAFLDGDAGPQLPVDTASVTDLGKAMDGLWVTIATEARADVRLRGVILGGDADAAKVIGLARVDLDLTAVDVTNAEPPEINEPAPEDPGSCDTPTGLFTDADEAAAFAAWPED